LHPTRNAAVQSRSFAIIYDVRESEKFRPKNRSWLNLAMALIGGSAYAASGFVDTAQVG